jgi:hypothetical protein
MNRYLYLLLALCILLVSRQDRIANQAVFNQPVIQNSGRSLRLEVSYLLQLTAIKCLQKNIIS